MNKEMLARADARFAIRRQQVTWRFPALIFPVFSMGAQAFNIDTARHVESVEHALDQCVGMG